MILFTYNSNPFKRIDGRSKEIWIVGRQISLNQDVGSRVFVYKLHYKEL